MPDAEEPKDLVSGYICVVIAILFFGSNYLPVKKFDAGDGFFFQWVNTLGIWVTGLVCGMIVGWPNLTTKPPGDDGVIGEGERWQLLAAVGGMLWATGNLVTVPVIKYIGLGLGMCIWSASNNICGWLSGILGIGVVNEIYEEKFEKEYGLALNIVGAIFTCTAATLYTFIRPQVEKEEEDVIKDKDAGSDTVSTTENVPPEVAPVPEIASGKASSKRVLGVLLAIAAGCFYGFNFNPVFNIIDVRVARGDLLHCKSKPKNALCKVLQNVFVYIFWHFTGIFATGTVAFLVYCAVKKNKPVINPSIILPAFGSGVMWAIAQISWFHAIAELGFAVAFPLITSGPGLVALLWGIFLFKEIGGKRNFVLLGLAIGCVVTGALCISLSKKSEKS